MPVTVMAPMSGDTVSRPVSITSAYFDLPAGTEILCTIGGEPDPEVTVDDTTGVHAGDPINDAPLGTHTVEISVNGAPGASQDNVTVTDGPTPVPIEEVAGPEKVDALKQYQVKGSVPDGSPAAYVVCQAIEVHSITGTRTPVAAGAATVGKKKWQVALKFEVKGAKQFQYVVRAFAYDKTMQLIGSETRFIEK